MVLRVFGDPLGLLFGALEGVLGLLLDLQIDPEALITIGSATSWVLFGLFLSLLAAPNGLEGVLGSSWAASRCSWAPPGTFLGALRCDLELQNWPYELLTND